MVRWVDPPGGWKYGFPKIWNGEGDIMDWLVQSEYPKRDIDRLGVYFYLRQWPADNSATCSD